MSGLFLHREFLRLSSDDVSPLLLLELHCVPCRILVGNKEEVKTAMWMNNRHWVDALGLLTPVVEAKFGGGAEVNTEEAIAAEARSIKGPNDLFHVSYDILLFPSERERMLQLIPTSPSFSAPK